MGGRSNRGVSPRGWTLSLRTHARVILRPTQPASFFKQGPSPTERAQTARLTRLIEDAGTPRGEPMRVS